jgi:hypothetical protein
MSFCIVECQEADGKMSISVAHQSWINKGVCQFPKFWKNVSKLKKSCVRGEMPDDSWPNYTARVVGDKYFGIFFAYLLFIYWLIIISYTSFKKRLMLHDLGYRGQKVIQIFPSLIEEE